MDVRDVSPALGATAVTPDLACLLADPARTADLPAEALPALLLQLGAEHHRLATVETAVAARLAAGLHGDEEPDRLLTVRQAASVLGMSEDWLYRHADRLPFTCRTGRRTVRFSERGLKRYVAAREA